MKLYRCIHKVEAAQWHDTDQTREAFADWFDMHGFMFETVGPRVTLPDELGFVDPSEWIVFDGEFLVMSDDDFSDRYVAVESP